MQKNKIIGFHQTNIIKAFEPAKFNLGLTIREMKTTNRQLFVSGSCSENNLNIMVLLNFKICF